MSYLATYKRLTIESLVGEAEGALRIPTDSVATAALVCIELNRSAGIRDARIEGEEAPRSTNNKNRNGGAR